MSPQTFFAQLAASEGIMDQGFLPRHFTQEVGNTRDSPELYGQGYSKTSLGLWPF